MTAIERHSGKRTGTIRNIRIKDINCDSECGILIHGNEHRPIENVTLENISLNLIKKSKWDFKGYDLRPNDIDAFVGEKVYGIYTAYVNGLKLNGIDITVDDSMKDIYGGERN